MHAAQPERHPLDGVLACTVRDCGEALTRKQRTWACPRGHSFDVARRGHVNLLQPQDRRSLAAGDSAPAVAARVRLLEAGIGTTVFDEIVASVSALGCPRGARVLDLGSGSGHLLGRLVRELGVTAIGIDLSVHAVESAAARFPEGFWIVANADRRLPLCSGSQDLVLSIHGRRNPSECARVLVPGGRAIFALPAGDDLVELRTAVQGSQPARARTEELVRELEPWFEVVARRTARAVRTLARPELLDLLRGTYRGLRASAESRVAALDSLAVTLASDVLVVQSRAR